MTLLRRPEPPAERFQVETPVATERLEAARRVMQQVGTRRRKLHRIQWALVFGAFAGLVVLAILHFASYWLGRYPVWLWYLPTLMQCFCLFTPSQFSATKRQREALGELAALGEKSDLPWLIEGTQYAGTPALRQATLAKIEALLQGLEPEEAAALPEGARKILRGWVWHDVRPAPETALLALQTLLLASDPKTLKNCQKLAKRELAFPGEESIRELAARTARIEPPKAPARPESLEEAMDTVARYHKALKPQKKAGIAWGMAILLTLLFGFVQLLMTNSFLGLAVAGGVFVLAVFQGMKDHTQGKSRLYAYRQALLVVAEQARTAEYQRVLSEGLTAMGEGRNQEALKQALQRIGAAL